VLAPAVVGDGAADLSWTYSGPAGHTGYEIRVQQISPAGPDQVIAVSGAGTLTRTVTGLTNGTLYRATVRAVYPTSFSAYSNAQDFSPASTFITQTIKVRRPQGALVLTQVCTQGSVGGTAPGAPAWNTTGGSPAVAGGYYTGGTADPLYSQYPYPQDALTGDSVAHYPTDCGIDLGAARLMVADDPSVAGNESGQFFQATGALNQVTVVDTRDTDPGWTVNGKMGTFTQTIPGAVIVGDQLGWTPIMTDDSDAVTFSDGSTYDQTVTAGPSVSPNQPSGTGLGSASGRQLATSPDAANAGLGIAKLDATLKLWIPITARTGNYIGVLTLTAV
jgi:hypothetical protein